MTAIHQSLALCLATATLLCGATPASADTKRFGLTSFERVEVFGDMIVEVTPNFRIGAVAEASRAALETLSLEVNNRTLVIRQVAEGPFGSRRASEGPIVIRLTAQNLQQVMLSGSGQLRVTGLRGADVWIDLDGAGRVEATVPDGTAVQLRATGSGQMRVSGRARQLTAIIDGASNVDASMLGVRDLTVRSIGTGGSLFAATGTADIVAGGSANVIVTGRARCSVRNTGAGTVTCGAGTRSPLPTTAGQ